MKKFISEQQIEKVKELVNRGLSIRTAAGYSGVSYFTAWKIINNLFRVEKIKEPQPKYFKHSDYYRW